MAIETQVFQKKPPAHEVIVALLRQYASKVQREAGDASHNPEPELPLDGEDTMRCASVLLIVLARMHIPEQARASVAAALRALPPNFIPTMDIDLYAEIEIERDRGTPSANVR